MQIVRRRTFVGLAFWATAFVGGYLGYNFVQNQRFAMAEEKREEVRAGLAHAEDLATAFRNVGKVVEPSVVLINVRKKTDMPRMQIPEEFRRFFRDRDGEGDLPDNARPRNRRAPEPELDEEDIPDTIGTGSGVIMETSGGKGWIVTNNHVAAGAEDMVIVLADGREIKNAKLLGADPKSDLAVIEVDAERLSPAKWGNSDDLQKGDWIMAFGSPFGYVGSMTHGIVSALNRQPRILGSYGYENFIQVDAPINPGNSGGPLVNLHGEVVGINTAIASRSGGFQGVGFTIPSNQAKWVYASLKEKGKVARGWLGVGIDDISKSPKLAKSFGFSGNSGVLVMEVIKQTPATGKLRNGDIITEVDGKPVSNVQQLRNSIASFGPGTDVNLKVFRDQKFEDVTIKLGEQPEEPSLARRGAEKQATPREGSANADAIGLNVQTLTPELARRQGIDEHKRGVIITRVQRNSPAAWAQLSPGDIVTEVMGNAVSTADQFVDEVKKNDLAKGIRLYVTSRDGEAQRYVIVSSEK